MRKTTQRVAALAVAATGFALIGSGCSTDTVKEKAKDISSSASSAASQASSAVSSAISSVTDAPTSTQIAGKDGTEYTVDGAILEKLNTLDEKDRDALGAPTDNAVTNPDGGIYQQFDGGVVVHTTRTYVVWGKIRDKWNELGGSQGELGYPTSDETTNAEGEKQTTFEHGTVTWAEGADEATATVK